MTFFFDNCIPEGLVVILRELDVDAVHLKEQFPDTTLDVDWIPEIGRRGWVLVTSDLQINHNSAEREALMQHRVTSLFMPKPFMRRNKWEKARWLLKNWQNIEAQAMRLAAGSIVKVTDGNGNLEPWH